MSDDDRIKRITRKHERYEAERVWDKFLLDAYAGTGGFEGRVRMPFASFWGAGADLYGTGAWASDDADEARVDTYLDRFKREDLPKFRSRAAIAHYPNPVETVVDIRLSYLNRKGMTREGIEALESGDAPWMQNVDGRGTTWSALMRTVIQVRASVIGWCPVLFDMPESDVVTVAEARARGVRPRAIPLWPANLYDWDTDDSGEVSAAKIGTHYVERGDILDEPQHVHRVSVWERHRVRVFELVVDQDTKREVVRAEWERPNPWGVVPLVIVRAKSAPTDSVRGLPMVATIAKLAKRLFNYLSELDEHLRSSTFAILQVPCDDAESLGVIVGGSGNALPVPTKSSTEYKFISPETSVAEVYERRIERTDAAIARNGRVEQSAASGGGQARSGLSRAFEFEVTNRAIADTAALFADGEQRALRLVMLMEGRSDQERDAVRVVAPQKFDVEEMAKEIEEALAAKSLDLGPTATAEMSRRLVRKLLPNLDEATLAKIDAELEARSSEVEEDRAFARAALRAGEDDGDDGDDGDRDDEDEDDEEGGRRAA